MNIIGIARGVVECEVNLSFLVSTHFLVLCSLRNLTLLLNYSLGNYDVDPPSVINLYCEL